ncbi:MAG: Gfo/Idh/MocA family protein [Dehalococcoidia bacterium]
MTQKGPVRVAVIGCGLIARRAHLPAYAASDEAELVAVCSGHLETARAAAEEFGARTVHRTWEETVADPEVEAVDICAPNALHAPIAIAAARAGKHVLVEKPMAISLDEADAMLAAARDAGVLLMPAHNMRYLPIHEEVKRQLDEGVIGRPFVAHGTFLHAGPEEHWGATSDWFWNQEMAGGGALLDLGIHMIDLIRWFIGRPVLEVTAMTTRVLKPTFADDNAFVTMRFAGDILANVQASWTARPVPDREILIHGERGHIAVGRSAAEPLLVRLQDGKGERTLLPKIPSTSPFINPFVDFVRSIREGTPPRTSGEEGRASLAVVLAAYESARTGRVVQMARSR